MPYFITEGPEGCKSGWATIKQDGEIIGCHPTKQEAIDQMVAVSISENMTPGGERALPEELTPDTFVAWLVGPEAYAGQVVSVDGDNAIVRLWEEEEDVWMQGDLDVVVPVAVLQVIEPLLAPEALPQLTESTVVPTRNKWVSAAWAIKARIEGLSNEARSVGGSTEIRTAHTKFEIRAEGDGMSFEGYAALFNSDSEPLPFIERIAPGAFKRSLQGRHRMMLLWNHDTSNPLASNRNGSLRLQEDNIGLKVSATLPNTTLGRDVAELVRTGVIDAMSFGFEVKKDSWSADGKVRTLEEVALLETSLVSFPAYEGTSGSTSVRSARSIDADVLANSLFKLESGEQLEASEAAVLNDVVAKLSKTEEVQEVDGDILALKKKKLDLLLKGI